MGEKWNKFIICLILGPFGVHKFCEKKIGLGFLYLFTFGLFGIGWIYDLITIFRSPGEAEGDNSTQPQLKFSWWYVLIAFVLIGVVGTAIKDSTPGKNEADKTPIVSQEQSKTDTPSDTASTEQNQPPDEIEQSEQLPAPEEPAEEAPTEQPTAESSSPPQENTVPTSNEPEDTTPQPKDEPIKDEPPAAPNERSYVLNKGTMKFHYPSCSSVEDIKSSNRKDFTGTRDDVIAKGYKPCGRCDP